MRSKPGPEILARSSVIVWTASAARTCEGRAAGVVAAREVDEAEAEGGHDDDEDERGHRGPPLGSRPRCRGVDLARRAGTLRQQVLEPAEHPTDDPARGIPCPAPGSGHGRHAVAHGVRQGDRRAVGRTGERFGRAHGHQGPLSGRAGHLGRLDRQRSVAAGSVGRHEPVMEMLHRRLGVERDEGILELVDAELGDEVRRGEHERVADGHLAAPDLGFEALGREAALTVRIGQRREPRLADEVGLGRPDGRHVQLVAADDGGPTPTGPFRRRRRSPNRSRGVGELLVRRPDRLSQADPDAGRLVVVVLVLRSCPRRAGSASRALLPGTRHVTSTYSWPFERMTAPTEGSCVRSCPGSLETIWLGHEAKLHLEPDGHAGLMRRAVGARRFVEGLGRARRGGRSAVSGRSSPRRLAGAGDDNPRLPVAHPDAQGRGREAAGRATERPEQLGRAHAQLLADDRVSASTRRSLPSMPTSGSRRRRPAPAPPRARPRSSGRGRSAAPPPGRAGARRPG